jgi:hypothetical protein
MAVTILALSESTRTTVGRSTEPHSSADVQMALNSGDEIWVDADDLHEIAPETFDPGVVAAASEGPLVAFGRRSRATLTIFSLSWSGDRYPPASSHYMMRLPSPLDGLLEIARKFLPSLFGRIKGDLEAKGDEWLGPFWGNLPEVGVPIAPLSFELHDGLMVGSLSGIGGAPALCRFKIPGAWYDTTGSVHLVRVGRPSATPEKWRSVEVYCETGALTVTPVGGGAPVVVAAGHGLRYPVRSDGAPGAHEQLEGLPGDVAEAIASGAYEWVPVSGGDGLTVTAISPGDGRVGLAHPGGQPVDLMALIGDQIQPLGIPEDTVPYHLCMRMASGVATNEGAMFERFGAGLGEAQAAPEGWMLDVEPGDKADLFLRVPRGPAAPEN